MALTVAAVAGLQRTNTTLLTSGVVPVTRSLLLSSTLLGILPPASPILPPKVEGYILYIQNIPSFYPLLLDCACEETAMRVIAALIGVLAVVVLTAAVLVAVLGVVIVVLLRRSRKAKGNTCTRPPNTRTALP